VAAGFFVLTFLKVHMGSIYPSDIIANLVILAINFIEIPNFHFWWIPIVMIVLMLKPISLFKKTPLWVAIPVSIDIFE
jgi:hypothetical protein